MKVYEDYEPVDWFPHYGVRVVLLASLGLLAWWLAGLLGVG